MKQKLYSAKFDRSCLKIESKHRRYDGFFKIDELVFKHALFAGGDSELVTREVFERGDAVAVLPYDPKLNRIVFIEQLRIGAYRSDNSPWLLEVVAGMIDKPEAAEQVARREAMEEAGLEITRLIPMLDYLSSPGGSTERLYLFLGIVDSSQADGVWGLAEEQEDIRVQVMDYDVAIELLNLGGLENAATVICLQWLALNKVRIDNELRDIKRLDSETS